MALTSEETRLLRQTFEAIRPDLEDASVAFYERLFQRAPHLEEMFRSDIANQGMRFMSAVGLIIDRLESGREASPHLRRLGEGHAALGVEPEHFDPMRDALIETFRVRLGDRFPPEAADAWRKAYDEIAAAMIAAGRQAGNDPGLN